MQAVSSFKWGFSPLRQAIRTSTFRLTSLYCVTFIVSSVCVTGFACWFSTNAMTDQIDDMVKNELVDVQTDAGNGGIEAMRAAVLKNIKLHSPSVLYLLEDSGGRVLAGNIKPIHPRPGFRSILQGAAAPDVEGILGRGIMLPDGNFLFIGVTNAAIDRMRDTIIWMVVWSMILTAILALIGGYVVSVRFLGRVEAISLTSRDIVSGNLSRRIALQGSGDELDHLSISLNGMLERIQDLMEGLRHVSNEIAHDLRTPLARLRYRLEAWRNEEASEEHRHRLDSTIADTDEILAVFEALLRIARIEAGALRAGFIDVDLSAALEEIVADFRVVAEQTLRPMFSSVNPNLVIHGDRQLINQLMVNLIENALTHTPPGTTISIQAQRLPLRLGGAVHLVVSDSGPGVPPDKLGKITQRFYRLGGEDPNNGTGLGLSLAQAIVKAHGGELTLEPNEPGLRCLVVLPGTGMFARAG